MFFSSKQPRVSFNNDVCMCFHPPQTALLVCSLGNTSFCHYFLPVTPREVERQRTCSKLSDAVVVHLVASPHL